MAIDHGDTGRRRHATSGVRGLLGHQSRPGSSRPLIDHFRLALFGIDDQKATLVLMVKVLAEGTWPEQRGLIVLGAAGPLLPGASREFAVAPPKNRTPRDRA
jgi:hypothetical protein